jgi:hypothetical protein
MHLRARDGQRDSNVSFDVGPADAAHAPSVKSLGITSQLAGSRADIIIPDDIEVPNNSATQDARQALERREGIRGAPHAEADLADHLPRHAADGDVRLQHDGQRARLHADGVARPLPEPRAAREVRRPPRGRSSPSVSTRTRTRGHPTDPRRFPDFDLMEREMSYGRSGFALQFMLDTSLSDANRYPLKLSDLVVHGHRPDVGPVNLSWASSPELVVNDVPCVGLNGDATTAPSGSRRTLQEAMVPVAGQRDGHRPCGPRRRRTLVRRGAHPPLARLRPRLDAASPAATPRTT